MKRFSGVCWAGVLAVGLLGGIAPLLLVSCHADPVVPDTTVTVVGTITDEGVECLALRDDDGNLYTLATSQTKYGPGDKVCVKGDLADVSFCMQGTTIAVDWIGPASQCR